MVDSKDNEKFGLGIRGLTNIKTYVLVMAWIV